MNFKEFLNEAKKTPIDFNITGNIVQDNGPKTTEIDKNININVRIEFRGQKIGKIRLYAEKSKYSSSMGKDAVQWISGPVLKSFLSHGSTFIGPIQDGFRFVIPKDELNKINSVATE